MTWMVWQQIHARHERWLERPMGEIAGEIYHHCYLGSGESNEFGESGDLAEVNATTEEDIEYLQGIADLYKETGKHYHHPDTVEIPERGEPINVDVWYQIGNPVGTRFRIYIHATKSAAVAAMRLLAPRIVRTAEGEKETDRKGIVAAKIASSRRAGQRPDTIVVYVIGSAELAAGLASELGGTLADFVLPGEPQLTAQVQPGIGMAWDPQCGGRGGHSFGEYCSAILGEALYDTVASAADGEADYEAFHDNVVRCFVDYQLDPDRPADAPHAETDRVPPKVIHRVARATRAEDPTENGPGRDGGGAGGVGESQKRHGQPRASPHGAPEMKLLPGSMSAPLPSSIRRVGGFRGALGPPSAHPRDGRPGRRPAAGARPLEAGEAPPRRDDQGSGAVGAASLSRRGGGNAASLPSRRPLGQAGTPTAFTQAQEHSSKE